MRVFWFFHSSWITCADGAGNKTFCSHPHLSCLEKVKELIQIMPPTCNISQHGTIWCAMCQASNQALGSHLVSRSIEMHHDVGEQCWRSSSCRITVEGLAEFLEHHLLVSWVSMEGRRIKQICTTRAEKKLFFSCGIIQYWFSIGSQNIEMH